MRTAQHLITELNAIADEVEAINTAEKPAADHYSRQEGLRERERVTRLRFDAVHWQNLTLEHEALMRERASHVMENTRDLDALIEYRSAVVRVCAEGYASIAEALRVAVEAWGRR